MKERAKAEEKHFCPYCMADCDTYDALKAHILSAHKLEPVPSPEGRISLSINDRIHTVNVEPEWTLYHLIHDRLGLLGSKQFCDRGTCGSCTVIVEGRPVLSCMTLAIECSGKRIETIEGIAEKEHPLIESYVDNHAMQCGYCTPGFVTTAKALLDRCSHPSEEDIKQALAGNLCRCGTYPQHPIAVLEASKRLHLRKGEKQ